MVRWIALSDLRMRAANCGTDRSGMFFRSSRISVGVFPGVPLSVSLSFSLSFHRQPVSMIPRRKNVRAIMGFPIRDADEEIHGGLCSRNRVRATLQLIIFQTAHTFGGAIG